MTDDRQLDSLRREARILLRAARSGDAAAHDRAASVLGMRADHRFLLADAFHVVAREHGATSWPDLVARARRGRIRSELDEALDDDGRAEIDVETDVSFPDGEPVTITIRRREGRFLLTDEGRAVDRAGRSPGWLEVAERAVRRSGMNVSRAGHVFVPAVEGRDLEELTHRLAQASLDVVEALVEVD